MFSFTFICVKCHNYTQIFFLAWLKFINSQNVFKAYFETFIQTFWIKISFFTISSVFSQHLGELSLKDVDSSSKPCHAPPAAQCFSTSSVAPVPQPYVPFSHWLSEAQPRFRIHLYSCVTHFGIILYILAFHLNWTKNELPLCIFRFPTPAKNIV